MEYQSPDNEPLRRWIDKIYEESDLECIRIWGQQIIKMRKEEAEDE